MKTPYRRRKFTSSLLIGLALLCLDASSAFARVVRVEILSRADITGTFGGRAYERLIGRVYFAFEPRNAFNKQIVDLDLAPRNPNGEVEAVSEFVMLRPKDDSLSANLAVIDIVNRGGMTTFVFNLERNLRASAQSAEFYGDALLMERGVTIVAIGWQWDVPSGPNSLHFEAPRVGTPARPITGLVRSDITIDAPTNVIPLGHSLGTAVGYPVANPSDRINVLTVRETPTGPRTIVSRREWQFAVDVSRILSANFAAQIGPPKLEQALKVQRRNFCV